MGTKAPETESSLQEKSPMAEQTLSINADGEHVVPGNYFWSPRFIGTVLAAGTSLFAGAGGFALVAPVLSVVNEDIGPSPSYVWIGLVNTLMLSVGSTLVGRLTDIFGRRWFIILSCVLAIIGCSVSATAQSVDVLIGGNVLIGLAGAAQNAFPFVLGELIPLKHRYLAGGLMYIWALPTAAFGPAIAYGFVANTAAGWRWTYYLMLIVNVISTILWYLAYHPPTFHMKNKRTRMQVIRDFDFVGMILFSGGLLVLLIGISWGGQVYPWRSGHVIATVVVGAVALIAFVIYECVVPLKEPLVPMHLFRNIPWVANVWTVAFGASTYYGFAMIFPQLVFGVYTSDQQYGSILCCALTASVMCGVICGGISRYIGKQKYQMIFCAVCLTPLYGACSVVNVDNKGTILGLIIPGSFFIGFIESVGVTSTSLSIHDQSEIGAAVGLANTIRSTWATVVGAIYFAILKNRLQRTIPEQVPAALSIAGLSTGSIPAFIAAIPTADFSNIPDVTPTIINAGVAAYKYAQVLAFRTVFLSTIAFGCSMIILTLFFPNLDHKMTGELTATLHSATPLSGLKRGAHRTDKVGELEAQHFEDAEKTAPQSDRKSLET